MNFEDIVTLVKAGYTKEEIAALTAETGQKPAEQKPAETGQKPAEQKPAEQKPAEQKPAEQKPAGTESAPDIAGVLNKINDTLAALQAAAITGDSRGAATKPTAGQSLAKAITMTK